MRQAVETFFPISGCCQKCKVSGISRYPAGGRKPSRPLLEALAKAVAALNAERGPEVVSAADILPVIRLACEHHGIRHVARVAGFNDANLGRIVAGKRTPSPAMVATLSAALGRLQAGGATPVANAP